MDNHAVKKPIKVADYMKHLDLKLSFKQRLVFVVVNVVMALLFFGVMSPVRWLFSIVGTELRAFLIVLVATLSFVKPISMLILIAILFVSFFMALSIFPL